MLKILILLSKDKVFHALTVNFEAKNGDIKRQQIIYTHYLSAYYIQSKSLSESCLDHILYKTGGNISAKIYSIMITTYTI